MMVCIMGDRDAAEEVVAIAFEKAIRGLPAKPEESPFVAWLCRIAHNEMLKYLKKSKRTYSLEAQPASQLQFATNQNVEEEVEQRELFQGALDQLTQAEQDLLLDRFEQGYSVEEIAKALGEKQATIQQRLWRAKMRFRVHFEEAHGKAASYPPIQQEPEGR